MTWDFFLLLVTAILIANFITLMLGLMFFFLLIRVEDDQERW